MANPEHVELVRNGAEAIREWRIINPDLDLNLRSANLSGTDFSGADLSRADFSGANLSRADLSRANLRSANLSGVDFSGANLSRADLSGTYLSDVDLSRANLNRASLSDAFIGRANLNGANLSDAGLGWTVISDIDLRTVNGFDRVQHTGPSDISNDTLIRSQGRIPDEFLRGCGFQPWEILQAKMYDPTLTPLEISELQYRIFDKRTHGPLFFGGVFISYSLADATFVDSIYERLKEAGVPVWLDRHDVIAGDLQKQIANAIRLHDVVLLVLSKASTESDWVENELDMARKKEKSENRDVLCPVKLDETWRAKLEDQSSDRVLWRTLTKKAIIDFSQGTDFEEQFGKLLRGLKIHYEPRPPAIDSSDS